MAFVGAVVSVACGSHDGGNVLVVSVEPQRAILEEIVGDRFEVVTVLTPGSNPETFEPTMATRKVIDRARAFFTTGHLPFEDALTESIPDDVTVYDTSKGIEAVYGTHGHDHGHEDNHHGDGADPHVWTSVRNARTIAGNMLEGIIDIDPGYADYYRERYTALDHRLDSLDKALTARFDTLNTRAFAVWHPSLSYLARDYGLEQISVGFENKEMPARQLARVLDEAHHHDVRVFFFQKEYDSRQAETLNNEMGTRLVIINPLAYDWESEIERIAGELAR